MKRSVVVSGIALIASVVSYPVLAADLPSRSFSSAPAYVPPSFSWTGFYVGANAGYAFNNQSKSRTVVPGLRKGSNSSSFTGGGQVGYNYQIGSVVLGLEADFNYSGFERKTSVGNARGGFAANRKVQWFGTVRSRIGFTPTERLLVFATGGLAYGKVKTSAIGQRNVNLRSGAGTDTRTGWTVGGGAEYAITNNLTVKGEYAYVNLGKHRDILTSGATMASRKTSTNFHVVRAGLNYKF